MTGTIPAMHKLRTAIAGILALFVATTAIAQTFPTVPGNTLIGRLGGGTTGPSQAIPFLTLQSQLLTFTQSGTGAITRTIQTKLREGWTFSLDDFGPTKDGSTNDTRWVVAAANATQGILGRRELTANAGAGYAVTPIQLGGSNPSTGTFTGTITGGTTLTVTSSSTIPVAPGQSITCGTCAANTVVTGYVGNAVGTIGQYTVTPSQSDVASTTITATAPSFTANFSGNLMTVTAIANGKLTLVDSLVGTDVIPGNTITAFGTGTGGTGTYTLAYVQPAQLSGVTVRAYPYTVVPITNAFIGPPGGQTSTVFRAFGSNATAQSVIKIVDPPAFGVVLGFEIGNIRIDANSKYRSGLTLHGFAATTSGGVPWAHDIAVNGATGCGVNVIGDAPLSVSWGVIEASLSRITSTANAGCGFNFNGDSGTSNYNNQSLQMDSLKANGNGSHGFIFDYTNPYCSACLAQSNTGRPFTVDHTNYFIMPSFYTEANLGGNATGTANSRGVQVTGQILDGMNSALTTSRTANLDYFDGANFIRNFGDASGQTVTLNGAVITTPSAGTGAIGASANVGLQLFGRGAIYDTAMGNFGGTVACGVLTGTQQLDCSAFSIGAKNLTMAGNVAFVGAFNTTFNMTAGTNVTLPTTGTLATLAGAEALTNKTLTTPVINGTITGTTVIPVTNGGTGVGTLGAGSITWLQTPSSANLRALITDESGTGALLFAGGNIGAATGTLNAASIDNLARTAYTPTVTASSGTPTTVTPTGRYKIIGKTVILQTTAVITAIGTATGSVSFSLPPAASTAAAAIYVGSCYETAVSAKSGAVAITASATTMFTRDAAAGSWWVNGYTVSCTITYEST